MRGLHTPRAMPLSRHPSASIRCTPDSPPSHISQSTGNDIEGSVLLTLQEPYRPDVVRMQAVLTGFGSSATRSFHFHTYGDMTVG